MLSTVCPDTVRAVAEALVSEVLPVTVRVPLEVNDEVAVIDPPVIDDDVRDVMNPVTELRSVAKKLDDVALVATRLVADALTVEKLLVPVALVK